jgi:hypothetical protein
MKNVVFVFGLTLVVGLGAAYAQEMGADVQVKAAIAKAKDLKPPANASKKTTVGKGQAMVHTANTEGDEDSFWVENIDLDGDGTVEETDVLYDDEDQVLYLYDDGDFKCKGGGMGDGDLLVAVNTVGNGRKRPVGSGWYVVSLDESECKAKAAGLYGCKFDASGNATACGLATVDEKNDEILIEEATE